MALSREFRSTGLPVLILLATARVAAASVDEDVADRIRIRLENPHPPGVLRAGTESLRATETLPVFYERRRNAPAWTRAGTLSPAAGELVRVVGSLDEEGLTPDHYRQASLERILDGGRPEASDPERLADTDLLLTDTFLLVAAHFAGGAVHPETIDPRWNARRSGIDPVNTLERALSGEGVEATLRSLLPQQPAYRRLRQELETLRSVAERGGWPFVPFGGMLERGMRTERVGAVRARLAASGHLADRGEATFDDALERAVRRFQKEHGLDTDGVVGPSTLQALNVPVTQRIWQVEANLERWRWLPADLGDPHVIVNIPGFRVDVFEGGRRIIEMRAVVGRPYRRTPVMSDRITYLVLNPFWNIPPGIARKDILPRVRKEPGYLEAQKIHVFRGWGADAVEVDPATVDWSAVNPAKLPYHFRQDPGPLNPLGRIKFMFPNRYDVYMHDTPSTELFSRDSRGFSSGCIRIEKPFELARFLLRGDPAWNGAALDAALERGVEKTIRLPGPVAIHLLYWTAWVEPDGTLQFRNDIYDRDIRLQEALRTGPGE